MPLHVRPAGEVPATPTRRLDNPTLRDLAQSNAGEELGKASWQPRFSYTADAAGRLTRVDLTVTLAIEMPVWTRYAARPPAERKEWDRFYRALLDHERGHIALIRREAQATYARLLAATATTIQARMDEESRRLQAASDAYDRQTDHGRRRQSPHGTTIIVIPPD